MQLNVTSEIGRLKGVLVHLPGREIDLMVPPMMTQLLFDDILYGQVDREEHRRIQQLIRFVADEVAELPMKRSTPTIEGRDVLVALRDLLLVGLSERTNNAGVRHLIMSLKASNSGVRNVIVVELPKQLSFMHLDTVFTFTSA